MANRWDVMAPRKGKDDKTFWHRVGTAWQGDKGISIPFDSLPLADDKGRVAVFLFEPREKPATGGKPAAKGGGDLDDEIPF